MNELALFAGAGGGILGGQLLGWTTVGAVEIEEYPRKILLNRQKDGHLDRFPIWDDIKTFDGKPWKGIIDVISGGFPCQDISTAGKGKGISGERSGLWKQMSRVADEIRPRFIFVENSPTLTSRGLGTVLGNMAEIGYNARWIVLGADDAGSNHHRKRIWILGYSTMHGQPTTKKRESLTKRSNNSQEGKIQAGELKRPGFPGVNENMADPDKERLPKPAQGKFGSIREKKGSFEGSQSSRGIAEIRTAWTIEPRLDRVAHGVADRVDRIKAIGNGQVPAVAAIAFTVLSEGLI